MRFLLCLGVSLGSFLQKLKQLASFSVGNRNSFVKMAAQFLNQNR